MQDHQASSIVRSAHRVLVVDDDPALASAYCRMLRKSGYEVEEANGGKQALERLRNDEAPAVHLVVLDPGQPDKNGLEVLTELRRAVDQRAMPLIVVTGAEELEHRSRALQTGASDYLVKPVALTELRARVDAQLRLVTHWRERLMAVTSTWRQLAGELGSVSEAQDVAAAANVVTRAATRLSDVVGAAFVVIQDERKVREDGYVACSHGDMSLNPWMLSASVQVRRLESLASCDPPVAERSECGLAGNGAVCAVPFMAGDACVGVLAVTLLPGLSAEHVKSTVAALEDISIMASPLVTPIVNREATEQQRAGHHRRVIRDRAYTTVFQQIEQIGTRTVVGYEALTRFDAGTRPDVAFADAALAGLQVELEQATAFGALEAADALPRGAYVSINLSAEALLDIGFLSEITSGDRPVVIEITEHNAIDDYATLQKALATIRGSTRIAVDDAGAGYAGLHHMRSIRPDIIKLDRSVVRGLDSDLVGRAMVTGMVSFAEESGISLVSEGIETEAELATLIGLGIGLGQGFLLGKPRTWHTPGDRAGLPHDLTTVLAVT